MQMAAFTPFAAGTLTPPPFTLPHKGGGKAKITPLPKEEDPAKLLRKYTTKFPSPGGRG
jgi:hypothetical protein